MEISIGLVFQIIIPTTVISGIISAIFTNYINWRINNLNYKRDYFKEIIRKRLIAYERIENFINELREVVIDSDNNKYHRIFSYDKDYYLRFIAQIYESGKSSIWLEPDTENKMVELNALFIEIGDKYDFPDQLVDAGKDCYLKIANLRDDITKLLKSDLLKLHDVKKFINR